MDEIKQNVERLAEINAAADMIALGQELRDEREIIVNYLKIMEAVELEEKGGFHFIGESADDYKEIYLNCYHNW